MAKNYTITFRSLRAAAGSDPYVVTIGGGTGAAVALKGGGQPFVTEEDDGDDIFQAVRTQSGYVRIVDDGFAADGVTAFDWKDLIPETDTSRPVTLTRGGTVLWQGYLQAQNFSGTLYGNPQEREFPVQCPLSSLSGSDVSALEREMQNFAYVLKEAFATLTGLSWGNFVFQGGASARDWLLKLVDWQNFVMQSDSGLTGRYDNLRVVDDICMFWGWSCRVSGRDVVFSCVDDATLDSVLTLSWSQLEALAGGTASGSVSSGFLVPVSLQGDIFASVDNGDYLVRGYSKATVSADGNPADTKVIGFAPSAVEKQMESRTWSSVVVDGKTISYSDDLQQFDSEFVIGTSGSGASFNLMKITEHGNDVGSDSLDVIKFRSSYSGSTLAELKTVFHHSYYDPLSQQTFGVTGGLILKGTAYRNGEKLTGSGENGQQIGQVTMQMRLGIGVDRQHAKWWTGTGWSSSETSFTVALDTDDGRLPCMVTGGGHGSTSYTNILPNETKMFGLMFVDFLGSEDVPVTDGVRSFDLADFAVEFVRSTASSVPAEAVTTNSHGRFGSARRMHVIERAGVRSYVAKNQSKVRTDWDADCIYASDNGMEFGYGVIVDTDGKQMGKQTYGENAEWPEQHLANRVAAYWAAAKRKMTAELRTDAIAGIGPRNSVVFDGDRCWPLAIGHDWRDDVTRVTLIEI